jgi:hypothetical protein
MRDFLSRDFQGVLKPRRRAATTKQKWFAYAQPGCGASRYFLMEFFD